MGKDNWSRRNVLKHLGTAGALGTGMVTMGTATASPGFRALIEGSIAETSNPDERREYLRDRGITGDVMKMSVPIRPDEQDGIGTKDLAWHDLEIHMGLYQEDCDVGEYDCSTHAVEMSFQFEYDRGESGDHPWDSTAMVWNDDQWDLDTGNYPNDTYARGPTSTYNRRTGVGGPGVAFNVDDASLGPGSSNWYTTGIYLQPEDSGTRGQEIFGYYTHTWSGGSVDSISLGWPPSITVRVSGGARKKTTGRDRGGNRLKVTR